MAWPRRVYGPHRLALPAQRDDAQSYARYTIDRARDQHSTGNPFSSPFVLHISPFIRE
ncbi:hypothetical protein DAI22_12g035100 [Oryza sativa Japonica Group]|nr:hypothetical protein DAI22_12g035100 [Oryza sativa Japonica Group]